MKQEDVSRTNLTEYVTYLISEFNAQNIKPFLNALDDEVVWIGPLHNQYLRTKAAVVKAFTAEHSDFIQETGPIYTEVVAHGGKQCDTISFFNRTGSYPGKEPRTFNMCYHISWVRDTVWKMSVISIMERPEKDKRDIIYPNYSHNKPSLPETTGSGKKLKLHEKGTGNTIYISPEQITRADGRGHECTIFFDNVRFVVSLSLRDLVEASNGTLLQCHSGYAVNPYCVKSISRFRIVLSDGAEVPVPEKRYTGVKARLMEMISLSEP